ncbi:hypothetical protein QTP88_008448 [Uroleucon formosanum]
MEPLAILLDKIQGENRSFLGYVAPTILVLRRLLIAFPNQKHCKPLSLTIIKATETRFSYLFDLSSPESKSFIISSISHPKFKLSWVPVRFMNICKTLFLNECSVVAATSEQFMKSVVVEIDSDSSDNKFYGNICSTERKIDDYTTASEAKRLNYANLQAISFLSSNKKDLDVLNEYPIIKEVFLKYNTTIPSSAPDERLFSKAIQVLIPRCNRLVRTEANEDFSSLLSDKKWVKYFEQRSYDTSSELLKICTFHFAIPAQNANVERIFSLMKAQWTDDRYRLLSDSKTNNYPSGSTKRKKAQKKNEEINKIRGSLDRFCTKILQINDENILKKPFDTVDDSTGDQADMDHNIINNFYSRGRQPFQTTHNNAVQNYIRASTENSIEFKLSGQKFSIQVDSTQDFGVFDQAAICIRYIFNGNVTEQLFTLVKVTDSSGKGYYNTLKSLFLKYNMNFTNVVEKAYDGAFNMRGESGLHMCIWCYSHELNLCICDTCQNINPKNVFVFLNRLSIFFRESYKYNNTRWWSREKALFLLIDGDEPLFSTVISKICSEASSILEKPCCFKIILTSHIFIHIFKIVGPTSRYLQTKGIDLLTAWNMIESVQSKISKIDFESVYDKAYFFSKKIKKQFSNIHLPEDIIFEDQLPTSRVCRKKRLCDELCEDQVLTNTKEKFIVETYRVIIDQILSSLYQRFSNNNDALTHIADLINTKKEHLKIELQNFSIIYPNLTTSVVERTKCIYKYSTKNITNSEKSSDKSSAENSNANKCKLSEFDKNHSKQSCLIRVFNMLYSLNLILNSEIFRFQLIINSER